MKDEKRKGSAHRKGKAPSQTPGRTQGQTQGQTTSRASRAKGIGMRDLALPIGVSALLTLILRIVYLTTTDNPFWRTLGLDLEIYDTWARHILEAPPFGGEPLGQAPFFPVVLSIAYRVLGADPVRALFAHLVPAVLATACVAWVAGKWKGAVAAWIAGVLLSIYGPAIFYTGVLLPPSWVLGLSALVLALGYRVVTGDAGVAGRIGTGLALGLLVWAQPVTLVLLLPLIAFGLATSGGDGERGRGTAARGLRDRRPFWQVPADEAKSAWLGMAWILLGLALPLSVTFGYNASKGAPSLVALNGGINLYIGNGPEANGAYVRPSGMEENRDLLGMRLAMRMLQAERAAVRDGAAETPGRTGGTDGSNAQTSGGAVPSSGRSGIGADGSTQSSADATIVVDRRSADRFWWNRATKEMTENPGRTASLFFRKLGFFFTNYEIPQVESLQYESRYAPLLRVPLPGMAVLVFGAALGALLFCRRDPVARWLVASALLLAIGVAVFFVTARFRMPVVPWMVVLTAGGLAEFWGIVRGRSPETGATYVSGATRPVAAWSFVAIAVVFGLISAFAPTGIVAGVSDGQYVFRQAVIAEKSGDTAGAMDGYRQALEIDPNLAKANVNLGTLLARQGKLDDARAHLERGVRLDPTSGIGHQNLGQLNEVQGRFDDAVREYAAAIEAEPDLVSARESAAYLLHTMGRIDESRLQLQEILQKVRKGSPPELRAGTLFSLGAERRSAVPQLVKEGARPDWWASSDLLQADVLLAQRQIQAAADLYRKVLADPTVAPYAQAILTQLEASGVVK